VLSAVPRRIDSGQMAADLLQSPEISEDNAK
jgi:hypothetical protein